jgi:alpha-methylacyl-CoA racemase
MGSGPLSDLKVVEIAGIGPGPFCAMLLADLGADVIRIDRPSGSGRIVDTRFEVTNRGRRSVAVDLKNPGGAEVVLRLAAQADILMEGYRPGVAERLGIGPDACWQRNPKLVYGRMTGWGQEGPMASTAGHDIAYIALTGALHAIGREGGPPQVPLNLLGDFGGGGMLLAFGMLAALWEAQKSGKGQVVDAAIVDGTATLAAMIYGMLGSGFWADRRGSNLLDTGAPFYDVYETSDGKWMAVGALEPQFYAELLRLLELDQADLPGQHDRSRWGELRATFAGRFKERTRDDWAKVFEGTDACVAPVLSLGEAHEHHHIAARGTLIDRDGVVQPAPSPRFSRTPGAVQRKPPAPGENTREALTSWGVDDVDALIESGAVVQAQ